MQSCTFGHQAESPQRHERNIGNAMDRERIVHILDSCLLTDSEYVAGPELWSQFEDPLPPIELETDEVLAEDEV